MVDGPFGAVIHHISHPKYTNKHQTPIFYTCDADLVSKISCTKIETHLKRCAVLNLVEDDPFGAVIHHLSHPGYSKKHQIPIFHICDACLVSKIPCTKIET